MGLYARVSTHDQQTLPMQLSAMRSYARKRGWTVAVEVKDVGSGATTRPLRENWSKQRGGGRLISCSCGGSIAGDGRSWIW